MKGWYIPKNNAGMGNDWTSLVHRGKPVAPEESDSSMGTGQGDQPAVAYMVAQSYCLVGARAGQKNCILGCHNIKY